MRAYRDVIRPERAPEHLTRLREAVASGDVLRLLVEAGELEQGVIDRLRPFEDGWAPADAALRELSLAAGRAYVASVRGADPWLVLRHASEAIERVAALRPPGAYTVKSPEGYAHYALDPSAYAASAEAYRRDAGPERARSALVLGIRSIGTSLSAVVAAATGAERSLTLRVRGESCARDIRADEQFMMRLRSWLADDPDVLVVDEGPGATGETFYRTWAWLRRIGVSRRRIALFPSHSGGLTMAPAERRKWFLRARKYAPPCEDARPRRVAARLRLTVLQDLGAGRWRDVVMGAAGEAAAASFERLKLWAVGEDGRAVHLRYAGAGRWGAEAEARARALAEAGLGPAVVGMAEGFLALEWLPGRILGRRAAADARLLHVAAEYVARRTLLFRTGRPADPEPLAGLLEENAREALGLAPATSRRVPDPEEENARDAPWSGRSSGWKAPHPEEENAREAPSSRALPADAPAMGVATGSVVAPASADVLDALERGLARAIGRVGALPPREAVVPDARLHPREWVFADGGFRKVDAIDHGDGLRWPGPTDSAWDLAGLAIELDLDSAGVEELVRRCAAAGREPFAELQAAVSAYRPIYAAASLGDAALSAREAFTAEDRRRLEAEAARYRAALARELLRAA